MKKLILIFSFVLAFGYNIEQFVTCKDVKNLTPINITKNFTINDKKVFAFAYFKNIKENKTIDFIWEKDVNGSWKIYADIKLPIFSGYRWRTYSYITIRPYFKGKWRVSLFDGNESVNSIEFNVTK